VILAKRGNPSFVALALFAQMRIEKVCVIFIFFEQLGNRMNDILTRSNPI
jgi:hypothetical protein